jgi:LacI family transcriptional regulator
MSLTKIAKEAGLSKATVSMVLNNKKSPLSFSEETKEKVWGIARRLNYQPNHYAQSLSRGKSMCIGIAGTGSLDNMDNVCITRIWSGAGRIIEDHKYNMMLLPLSVNYVEGTLLKMVRSKMVDGVIIHVYSSEYESFNAEVVPFLHQEKVPFVAVHSTSQPLACHNVGFNAVRAGYLATRHLIERDITDIGMVCCPRLRYNEELFAGYQAAMRENNFPCQDLRFTTAGYDDTAEHGYAFGKKILHDGQKLCEGYVFLSDYFAYGFMEALAEAGKQAPEDVLVVACDNSFKPAYFRSRLTTIDRQFEPRGAKAAEFLFTAIDNKTAEAAGFQTFIAQPELVVRQTSMRKQ